MRNAWIWVALLLAVSLLIGCGSEGVDSTAGSSPFLSLGTAPPGGAFFVVGSALAEVLNEQGDQQGWSVTAEATKGSQENIRRLVAGELDLALANSSITYFAVRGQRGWTQPHAVQAVMTLAPNVALFVSVQGSGVRTISDLRGQRVVVGPAGAGFEFFVEPLLEAHGLSFSDFTPLNATQAGAVDLLSDGSAAAAFLGGAVPTASITQLSTSQDAVFIPFGEEEMERLTADYPFFDRATIPAGTYRGQSEDFHGLNVGSMHLITAASADEELIYRVTRTLYENRQRVVEKHPAGRAINDRIVIRNTGAEFHPGAIRFYREIGIWPEATADGK